MTTALVPVGPAPARSTLVDLVGRSSRIGFGTFALVVRAGRSALGAAVPGVGAPVAGARPPHGLGLVPGAALGLAMEAETRVLAVVGAVGAGSERVARAITPPILVDLPLRHVELWLLRWHARARIEQERNRLEATEALRAMVQAVTQSVVAGLDLAALVDRIPIEEVIDRLDFEAIIARIDIGPIVRQAMDDVDIYEIVRESTQGITGEAVDTVRSQAMGLDTLVERIVDRILFRKGRRDLRLEPEAP